MKAQQEGPIVKRHYAVKAAHKCRGSKKSTYLYFFVIYKMVQTENILKPQSSTYRELQTVQNNSQCSVSDKIFRLLLKTTKCQNKPTRISEVYLGLIQCYSNTGAPPPRAREAPLRGARLTSGNMLFLFRCFFIGLG